MLRRIKNFALSLAFAMPLIFGQAAFGQGETRPANPPGKGGGVPAAKTVSVEDVFAYFKTLDPNAKQMPMQNGTQFVFNYQHKELKIPLAVAMNNGYLWFACRAGSVDNADQLSAELLAKMLRAHFPVGPTFFRIAKVDNVDIVELAHRIDRPATTERIGMALQEMAGDIETTEPIWKQIIKRNAVQ